MINVNFSVNEALAPDLLSKLSALTPTTSSPYHPTSHVPSDKAHNVHDVVTQRKSELAILDGHIDLLSHALEELQTIQIRLKEQRALLQESLSVYETLASPTCRILPPELLGEIFLWCLPQTNYVIPSPNDCPLILTRVCRQWRAVALSTPQLWASLNLSLSRAAETSSGGFYKSWLEKAGRVPLSIRVVHDIDLTDWKEESLLDAIQWLRPFLNRCSDLWWHGPPVQGLLDDSSQSLSRFQVTSHKADFRISLPSPTPHLRYVVLRSIIHDLQSLRSIDMPWHQLLDLKIQFALVSSATFLEVIGLSTQLQQVSVSCVCDHVSPRVSLQPVLSTDVVNHSIRRLEVNVIRGVLGSLFAALTLPALEELTICFCSPEKDPWPHEQFASFITRSKCPLKWLIIHRNKGVKPHLTEYLRMLPGLKTLGDNK